MFMDIIKQGARARAMGRKRDACPYPGESRERRAWFEGFDGSTAEMAVRLPHPARMLPEATMSGPPHGMADPFGGTVTA